MKKLFSWSLFFVMLFTVTGFAQAPQTIDDLVFMKNDWFTSSTNYTYYNITVGENTEGFQNGSVGSLHAYKKPNTDVYTLNVLNDGIVTISVMPTNAMYGTKTNIEGISFISDISGIKRRYSASDNNTGRNGIRIVDFNGKGSCQKSRYLTKGTYYFAVSGSQYSSENRTSNDLINVNYDISVTMDTFADNLNSSAENPYIVNSTNDIVKGILGMELHYSADQDKFLYDTSDKIVFPSGNKREIKLTITSSGKDVLKTIDPYGKLNGFIKDSGNSMVDGTKFELGYGETIEMTANLEANEKYSIELVESFPKEYTILYEELASSDVETSNLIVHKPTVPRTPIVKNPRPVNTVPISVVMTDKDTGAQVNVTKVVVNGKEMTVLNNGVLDQQVPDIDGKFKISVTAEGYGKQEFEEAVLYDGLNFVYLYLKKIEPEVESVKPIIMLHTACDISPKTFDNRNYKIFIDDKDFTNNTGYMGHITNLPESKVGDTYKVRVEVEGYKPYEEIITIPPSEYEDGNAVVFVDVNTIKESSVSRIIPEATPTTAPTTIPPAMDTASSWAKEQIEKAIKVGLGTEKMINSNFRENATREEFCELVVKLFEKLGGVSDVRNNPFVDTNNQAVLKAYNAGIINGTGDTTFSPNNSITREQLCVMIIKALDASGKSYESDTTFQKPYEDIDSISSWAKSSVKILNGYEIINGNGTSLDPEGKVTKEMAVLIAYRVYEMFK